VRADLPRGIQAAQILHAGGESIEHRLPSGTYAVVLTVPSERALVHLADDLRRAGIEFTAIFEPDAPYDGALMALGLAPRRKEVLRRVLSNLPLLR
jgi:peptidyl-tRNA hydrolase